MSLNRKNKKSQQASNEKKNKATLVLWVGLLATLASGTAEAASQWNSDAGWGASDESGSRKGRSSTRLSSSRYQISPFSPGSNNLGIDIGQIFLMGDLTRDYADSIGSQIRYTYGVSEMFGFDASFGYSSHTENKYSLAALKTGIRMNLAWFDKVIPYTTFGLGFFRPAIEVSANNVVAPVLFGLHGGAGVNLEVTQQLYFGASLTLHDMFGTKRQLADGRSITVDGNYTSFLLNAGVTF
jgi:hypothetical protein